MNLKYLQSKTKMSPRRKKLVLRVEDDASCTAQYCCSECDVGLGEMRMWFDSDEKEPVVRLFPDTEWHMIATIEKRVPYFLTSVCGGWFDDRRRWQMRALVQRELEGRRRLSYIAKKVHWCFPKMKALCNICVQMLDRTRFQPYALNFGHYDDNGVMNFIVAGEPIGK